MTNNLSTSKTLQWVECGFSNMDIISAVCGKHHISEESTVLIILQ